MMPSESSPSNWEHPFYRDSICTLFIPNGKPVGTAFLLDREKRRFLTSASVVNRLLQRNKIISDTFPKSNQKEVEIKFVGDNTRSKVTLQLNRAGCIFQGKINVALFEIIGETIPLDDKTEVDLLPYQQKFDERDQLMLYQPFHFVSGDTDLLFDYRYQPLNFDSFDLIELFPQDEDDTKLDPSDLEVLEVIEGSPVWHDNRCVGLLTCKMGQIRLIPSDFVLQRVDILNLYKLDHKIEEEQPAHRAARRFIEWFKNNKASEIDLNSIQDNLPQLVDGLSDQRKYEVEALFSTFIAQDGLLPGWHGFLIELYELDGTRETMIRILRNLDLFYVESDQTKQKIKALAKRLNIEFIALETPQTD